MVRHLTAMGLADAEGKWEDSIIELITNLMAMYNGSYGEPPVGLEESLVHELVD